MTDNEMYIYILFPIFEFEGWQKYGFIEHSPKTVHRLGSRNDIESALQSIETVHRLDTRNDIDSALQSIENSPSIRVSKRYRGRSTVD
jgi:hypothetical protein